jgi:hypothetical protein
MSITSDFRPAIARPAATLIAVVVLPTPPFWFDTAMTLATFFDPSKCVIHPGRQAFFRGLERRKSVSLPQLAVIIRTTRPITPAIKIGKSGAKNSKSIFPNFTRLPQLPSFVGVSRQIFFN